MHLAIAKLIVPVVAAALFAGSQDAVNFVRAYKADETSSVRVQLDVDMQGNEIKASATVATKIAKLLEGGKAKALWSAKDVRAEMGGNELPVDLPDMEATLDGQGLPQVIPTNQAEWLFSIASIGQMTPGKSLKPGEEFTVAWASDDKMATIKGKGKFLEVVEVDGAKAAKVEYTVQVAPENNGMSADMKSTAYFEPATGKFIRSEGKMEVGGEMTMKFTVKLVK